MVYGYFYPADDGAGEEQQPALLALALLVGWAHTIIYLYFIVISVAYFGPVVGQKKTEPLCHVLLHVSSSFWETLCKL